MTESKRAITGLSPRRSEPDLSRLRRSRRPVIDPAAGETDPAPAQVSDQVDERPAPLVEPPAPTRRPAVTPPPAADAADTVGGPAATQPKSRATIYLDADLRGRSRSAYRATAQREGDSSWSEFIETAIRREVERREAEYNDGRPYEVSAQRLPAGRPLG